MRRTLLLALTLAAVAAPDASADGLPVLGIDVGGTGVTAPGAVARYVTVATPAGTLVERIRRDGGQVLHAAYWPGTFTVPAVAYDGSAGGLSGDGRTLVLIEPRSSFPRARTRLLVLRAPGLRDGRTIDLRGDFSFDAISPDGGRIYLIQYVSAQDPTRYAVRSYDVASRRLDPEPIVDPAERGETMRGQPLSRAASVDGRWAYTLYDGGGEAPFVHALDTARGTARCIDLDGLDRGSLWRLSLRLAAGGRSLGIVERGRTVLAVDTRTFAVASPHARSRWPRIVLPAVALVGLAVWLARRRPGRLVPDLAP